MVLGPFYDDSTGGDVPDIKFSSYLEVEKKYFPKEHQFNTLKEMIKDEGVDKTVDYVLKHGIDADVLKRFEEHLMDTGQYGEFCAAYSIRRLANKEKSIQ
ncbi:MAG: hypothetical protein PHU12_00955 [Candidatus Aenigmarchaeota archaeon]|nr:hypothetical protein [Candidatus Aenigmarchaeota archaeon]